MDSILQSIEDWFRELLVTGIMDHLTSTFDSVNDRVGEISTSVGMSPAGFSPAVFGMIENISTNVIMPIAGIILTFIACYELIQLVISHNNLANFETWIFWKWIFKTFVAVTLITNTMNITMAVFDVAQHVINNAGGLIAGSTAIDASALAGMQATLEAMDGRYCPEHQQKVNSNYEKYGRDKATKKRYGRAWKRIRDKYASEHPFCELCFERGIIVETEEIHHKKPLSEGGTHDRSNLIALCKSCHSQIHAKRGDYWGGRR